MDLACKTCQWNAVMDHTHTLSCLKNIFVGWCSSVHSATLCWTSSVCLWQVGALQKRWEIGLWLLWTAYMTSVTVGLLWGPISNPYNHPFLTNWGLITPSQNLHCKLHPNGVSYNGCFYWQPMGTYHCPTQQYHRRPLLQKGGSQNAEHELGCRFSLPSFYIFGDMWSLSRNILIQSSLMPSTAAACVVPFLSCILLEWKLLNRLLLSGRCNCRWVLKARADMKLKQKPHLIWTVTIQWAQTLRMMILMKSRCVRVERSESWSSRSWVKECTYRSYTEI